MRTTGQVLGIAVLLLAMTAVGCQKKVQLTFYNHTADTLPVKVTTPTDGTQSVGSIGGNGSMLNYTVRIPNEDLPAGCSAAVGIRTKPFTVTEDTKDKLFFHYTDKGLAGPMDKDAGFTHIQKTGEIEVRTESRMIVD